MFVSEIISYPELVAREKANLQKGMNFGIRKAYSIILMSVRRGAPYHDRLDLERNLLIRGGHDVHRSAGVDLKKLDQPMTTPRGGLTENGKLFRAAKNAAAGVTGLREDSPRSLAPYLPNFPKVTFSQI